MFKLFKKATCLMASVILVGMTMVSCGTGPSNNNGTDESLQATQEKTSREVVTQAEKQDVKIAAMKGPTAIGMVQIMKNAKEGKASNNYEFKIAGAADEFTADLLKGDIQIAALPCNVASTLYNKSNGKIQVAGINTLGVLYILDTGKNVQTVQDLKGKTIYSTGKGTTPEYTLRHLLKSAGIDPDKDVTIEYKSEATEVAAVMASNGEDVIAMLPQPYVTTVLTQNKNARIALDVTKEWEKISGADNTVVTGVIVVNAEFAKKNPEVVASFMKEYEESTKYVNANVEAAANLVEEFGIFKAAVAKQAIPYCNITYVTGDAMKTRVNNYLNVLNGENPASIGGAMPKDDFFLTIK